MTFIQYGIILNSTDDGLVKATSQILYGQYHSWDLYVLGLKINVLCKKKFQPPFWKKLRKLQISPLAVGMASNFGHRSRSRRS